MSHRCQSEPSPNVQRAQHLATCNERNVRRPTHGSPFVVVTIWCNGRETAITSKCFCFLGRGPSLSKRAGGGPLNENSTPLRPAGKPCSRGSMSLRYSQGDARRPPWRARGAAGRARAPGRHGAARLGHLGPAVARAAGGHRRLGDPPPRVGATDRF